MDGPRTCPHCREDGISLWSRGMEAMPKTFSGRITCRRCRTKFRFELSIGSRLLVAVLLFGAVCAGVALIFSNLWLFGDYAFGAIVLYVVVLVSVVLPWLAGSLGVGTLHPVDADR
jgi:hypothetical protein